MYFITLTVENVLTRLKCMYFKTGNQVNQT